MPRKKNYLKQHKQRYLKCGHSATKKVCICIFLASIVMSAGILCGIFVDIEKESIEKQNETSFVINQAVSVKKTLRTDFSNWNETCDWNLVVVNESNALSKYFKPELKFCGEIEIAERINFPLSELLNDASREGIKLWISTGYRSLEKQEQIFQRQVNDALAEGLSKASALEKAKKETSQPRYSEHHTGLAVDFNAANIEFTETAEYIWLLEHAQNYGFILRYPQDKETITGRPFEPAHFRYVGEDHARVMKSQNLCLEEYVSRLIR